MCGGTVFIQLLGKFFVLLDLLCETLPCLTSKTLISAHTHRSRTVGWHAVAELCAVPYPSPPLHLLAMCSHVLFIYCVLLLGKFCFCSPYAPSCGGPCFGIRTGKQHNIQEQLCIRNCDYWELCTQIKIMWDPSVDAQIYVVPKRLFSACVQRNIVNTQGALASCHPIAQ